MDLCTKLIHNCANNKQNRIYGQAPLKSILFFYLLGFMYFFHLL